MRCCE